jgi:hypothetical protein
MTFEEAILISVRKYYGGRDPEELMGVREGETKYTREYFDQLEKDIAEGKLMGDDIKNEEDEEVEEDELD